MIPPRITGQYEKSLKLSFLISKSLKSCKLSWWWLPRLSEPLQAVKFIGRSSHGIFMLKKYRRSKLQFKIDWPSYLLWSYQSSSMQDGLAWGFRKKVAGLSSIRAAKHNQVCFFRRVQQFSPPGRSPGKGVHGSM